VRGMTAVTAVRRRSLIAVGAVMAILPVIVPAPAASAAGPVGVSLGSVAVVEGDTGLNHHAVVSVTLSDPSTTTVSVPFQVQVATAANAATPFVDFVRRSGTAVFKPSAKTGLTPTTKFVAVQVVSDLEAEGDEVFVVTLGTPSGGTLVGPATMTSTVIDQDPSAPATVSVGDVTITEGNSGADRVAKVNLSLSEPLKTAEKVWFSVGNETAVGGSDYRSAFRVVTLPIGTRDKTVPVRIIADTSPEPDEALRVGIEFVSAGLTIGRAQGHVVIVNDD
jgi:hypothetical protein